MNMWARFFLDQWDEGDTTIFVCVIAMAVLKYTEIIDVPSEVAQPTIVLFMVYIAFICANASYKMGQALGTEYVWVVERQVPVLMDSGKGVGTVLANVVTYGSRLIEDFEIVPKGTPGSHEAYVVITWKVIGAKASLKQAERMQKLNRDLVTRVRRMYIYD